MPNICSTDCIQNVLILLTAISLNFFHSAFDHSCYNFVCMKLYPSKSIKKGGEVLSLCPLCQQCFGFFFLYWILLYCWKKTSNTFISWISVFFTPSDLFVRQKVQGYNCDVKHFVSFFLFYPCSLEHSEEFFMLYPVIIISVRGQAEYFNASRLTGQGHVTGDVMPDR